MTYHGVAERIQQPWLQTDFITLASLREQLDFFEKRRRVVSLDELLNCIAEGRPPDPRFLVLCFDDALACLPDYVIPELAARSMPFIIGVPAALPDTGRSLWEYEAAFLVYLLNRRDALVDLAVAIRKLGQRSGLVGKTPQQPATSSESGENGSAATALGRLKQFLRFRVASQDRIAVLDELLAEFEPAFHERLERDSRFRVMRWEQLRNIGSVGGSLAAHGFVHHPHNATLGDACRIDELRLPMEVIKQQTGTATNCFIWPEGVSDDASMRLGIRLGYQYFLSTRAGCVSRNTLPTDVPRVSGQWPLPQMLWNAARLK